MCVELFSTSYGDLLDLTGLFGIRPRKDFDSSTNASYDLSYEFELIHADAEYEGLLDKFYVLVNSKRKYVHNLMFILIQKGNGYALNRLLLQIETCRRLGYGYISLLAAGDPTDKRYIGYRVWCKYGFKMTTQREIDKFNKLMKDNNRSEKDLNELVMSNDGKQFWEKNGFPWMGYFDLSNNSESEKILTAYIENKNQERSTKL